MKVKRKIFSGLSCVAALSVALLTACGGGGSDGTDDATSGPNAFKEIQATFAVACKGKQTWARQPGLGVVPVGNLSNQGSIAITELVGTDRANVTLHFISYESVASDPSGGKCDPAKVTQDITVTGQIRDLGVTKTYAGVGSKNGTAKVVEFTYHGFKLAKGSLSGLQIPAPNVTTKTTYLLEGNRLHVGSGDRNTDGLPWGLSSRFGLKQ